ncbi:trypsin-like peptidase domain-containing protein [Candidatus Kaiserbacteria bacterium]|nr:trypsin-like peptidase domain-containing protein [Candidatus Kaiserbacteria bacterium]
MQFIQEILVAILMGYLAFTNNLATIIAEYIEPDPTSTNEGENLVDISSQYQHDSAIPSVLLDNINYQGASVIDGVITPPTKVTTKEALVNIFCTFTTDEYTRSTTGSGYFINDTGVIITNAHVAQFLLLDGIIDGDSSCVLRTGTPATPTYNTDLLYISPAWIQEHANLLTETSPSGTGERDYALLYVTGRTDQAPMPAHFPALAIDTNLLTVGAVSSPITAAGYPASIMQREGSGAELIEIETQSSIVELMTFGSNYVDLFSIAGSKVGEQGASGGPIVNEAGRAIGMISTKGDDSRFGAGSLRAISLSYVDRTIKEETGYNLAQNVSGNLPFRAKIFRQTMVPFLQTLLSNEL